MGIHINAGSRRRIGSSALALTLTCLALAVGAIAWHAASKVGDTEGGSTPSAWPLAWLKHDATHAQVSNGNTAPEAASRSPEALRALLYKGSFAGTHPFGDWCVTPAKALRACPELRDRFEYYINGLGEITPAEVRVLIEDEAIQAHGPALAAQIMKVFDAYWTVRNHEYPSRIDMADTDTWLPALREAQAFRKQTLGEDWTQAFFASDDKEFMDTLAQASSGQAPPPSSRDPVPRMDAGLDPQAVRADRVARYGKDAADRLDALDIEQARFDGHVAEARQEWVRLQAQANLSAPAREAQLKAFITERVDPKNLRRALLLATSPAPTH